MKHGRKPTRAQKIFLSSCGLNYKNWLVLRDDKTVFEIVHRLSGKPRRLEGGRHGK